LHDDFKSSLDLDRFNIVAKLGKQVPSLRQIPCGHISDGQHRLAAFCTRL
jgi:hypothetical protein